MTIDSLNVQIEAQHMISRWPPPSKSLQGGKRPLGVFPLQSPIGS